MFGSSRREQKTPNPLPSGFPGCLPGPCSDGAPSSREQNTPNPLPSGFGERLGGAGRARQLYIIPFPRTQNRPFCSQKTRGTTGTPGIRRGVTIFGDIQCHLAEEGRAEGDENTNTGLTWYSRPPRDLWEYQSDVLVVFSSFGQARGILDGGAGLSTGFGTAALGGRKGSALDASSAAGGYWTRQRPGNHP
jgi:hypothetical protein